MTTTDIRNSIRSMNPAERTIALAVSVLTDRINGLAKADRDDLYGLLKELVVATTDEDRAGIFDTMVEILDGRTVAIRRQDLAEAGTRPERWRKWVGWISKRVRDARTEAGLTQEQLAESSGLPQSHISRIETGKLSPSRATIEKLASALGKPTQHFDCD